MIRFLILLLFCLPAWATPTHKSLSPTERQQVLKDRTLAKIRALQDYYANLPYLTGTKHYFCNCGTGAATGCTDNEGNDADDGLTIATAKQSLSAAKTVYNALGVNDSVLLCKGGAWADTGGWRPQLNYGTCAGQICNEIREYSPTVTAETAKPFIDFTGAPWGFEIYGAGTSGTPPGYGSVRIMNLSILGDGIGVRPGVWVLYGGHDVLIANNDIYGFYDGVYVNGTGSSGDSPNVTTIANNISESTTQGFIGNATNNHVQFNYMINNGSDDSSDHQIYIGVNGTGPITGGIIQGNYMTGRVGGGNCAGTAIVGHSSTDGLQIVDNYIDEPSSVIGTCYGIGMTDGDGHFPPAEFEQFSNMYIARNILINAGQTGITVDACPNTVIEDNLLVFYNSSTGVGIDGMGLNQTKSGNTTCNNLTIRNNTVAYMNTPAGNVIGIQITNEGTGHVVANNIVYSTQTGSTLSCYYYPLTLTSYAFINNNNCYSATASYNWEATRGSLASWQSASSGALYAGASGDETGKSVYGNPAFVDTANLIYRPTAVVTGAGDNTNKAPLDLYLVPRPNPPTMGAVEQ